MSRHVALLAASLMVATLLLPAAEAHRHHHSHSYSHSHHHHDDCDGEGDCDDWDGFNWDWDFGNKSMDQAYSECICWNSTDANWCYANSSFHKGGAEEFFSRRSCQQLITHLYWWVFPATVLAIFFVVFPMLFCLSRMLCNCCGGRNPSYGCCCPVNNKLLLEAQGDKNYRRPYSKCSTRWAKFLALVALIAYVSVGVHGINNNARTGSSVVQLMTAVKQTVFDLQYDVNTTLTALTALAEKNLTTVSLAALRSDVDQYTRATRDFNRTMKDVKKAEDEDDMGGRFGWTLKIVAIPLVVYIIVTILAFLNVRGLLISLSMGLLSFLAFVMCVAWMLTLAFSRTLIVSCNNYDNAFSPFVVHLIHSQKGCGATSAIDGINATEFAYVSAFCASGISDACTSEILSCPTNVCRNPLMTIPGTSDVVVNLTAMNIMLATARTPENLNLSACAANPACTLHQTATSAMTIVGQYSAAVATLNTTMGTIYNCSGLRSDMRAEIYPALCGSLSPKLHKLSMLLVALSMVMLVTLFIWIYGAKRFTKPGRRGDFACVPLNAPYDSCRDAQPLVVTAYPAPEQNYDVAPPPTKGEKEQPLLVNYGSV